MQKRAAVLDRRRTADVNVAECDWLSMYMLTVHVILLLYDMAYIIAYRYIVRAAHTSARYTANKPACDEFGTPCRKRDVSKGRYVQVRQKSPVNGQVRPI